MIECAITKQFEAWHEQMQKYVVATMMDCTDGSHKLVPPGTRYTVDTENNIIWIVDQPEMENGTQNQKMDK